MIPAHPDQHANAGGATPPATVRVWGIFIRIFHWGLVTSFAIAWITADEWDRLHEWAGYVASGLVTVRIVWGFAGKKYARLSQFVRSPGAVLAYLGDVLQGRERRYLGHNPAGGVMIIALLLGICSLGLTGWMMTLNTLWGVEWVEEVHEGLANLLLLLVVVHVAGVILASIRHGENLIVAMFGGHKRASTGDDVG